MQSNWLTRLVLSAVAYVAGRMLYLFFVHRHVQMWAQLPATLESWAFFAATYWILNATLSGKGRNA